MKHYVLGLLFNHDRDRILLVKKLRPERMKGYWNGIGGKIEEDETSMMAMHRESTEECGHSYMWYPKITFTCPHGTVFVFAATYPHNIIDYEQIEDEELCVFEFNLLPHNMMRNLDWIIPLCLASVQFPIMVNQTGIRSK